jgi:hypothetical protein
VDLGLRIINWGLSIKEQDDKRRTKKIIPAVGLNDYQVDGRSPEY